ncbi:DUF726-domain-containing protein [Aaosphaeria arxii CBS 175.79]|uniref:DUF726-domain-containing protein n=1 Tax=Aaosphaeria arxii CBS 175.79 TaxID=1450172 RepID=A0A6A5XJZ8_9PLEO|nr:DUF726-domain-containing protein [Aaosphaeria arxii CBS 175.79]KAF2013206.1 DUF726-domain-containing protein [Aaosphaeria arxii CBS 175.79]
MPNEPVSGEPPIAESKDTTAPTTSSQPPKEVKQEVEYDDFGLPIRKARPRAPVESDSDEEEQFQDAVASSSKGSVKEKVEILEKKVEAEIAEKLPEKGKEKVVGAEVQEKLADSEVHQKVASLEEKEKVAGSEEKGKVADLKEKEKAAGSEEKVVGEQNTPDTAQEKEKIENEAEESPGIGHQGQASVQSQDAAQGSKSHSRNENSVSGFSHQPLVPAKQENEAGKEDDDGGWQTMPAYAHYDMYDDDNKLIARENAEELEDMSGYGNLGGAAKGYTRVTLDDDVESQTSMDDNTAYLFKEKNNTLYEDDDEAARDPLSQMQTTKELLTEGQRVAYVGLVRLAMVEMQKKITDLERTKSAKKVLDLSQETSMMWSQKMMVRLYSHMDIDASEQIMIEQLSQHGVIPDDLTPALMQNARVKNPAREEEAESVLSPGTPSMSSPRPESINDKEKSVEHLGSRSPSITSPRLDSLREKNKSALSLDSPDPIATPPPPPYQEHEGEDLPAVRTPSQLPDTKNIDIDLRWTVLCDLFLVLIADSVYDARSRTLLEQVGKYLSVDWLEICRFEKRVTDALEMQEEAAKENWNEDEHIEARRKRARNKRIALMGLATVGGSLVIGLSAGILAPVIGTGLALGFGTIGIGGTGTFLAGAGGAAIITTTGVLSGGTIAVRAADRRTGAVQTFEYRPLHNNKRVNLIVTLAGWMNGKVDDVRLPYSTVDPIMGDIYSVLWEPEMLRSMGDTINILATEALTQGLQQVLGSTILIALMSAIQLPVALTKLSYLIDNPWTVSQTRADMAGLILADSLIERNLGTRPVTLVGFSLGSRVIYSCLKELAKRGAFGIVENVYMFGTPVVAKKDDYIRARALVPGRFVNGYAKNDWILGYLFRATGGGISRVAGLASVDVPGIENVDVTEHVPGHMAYRAAMPKLLREVGWIVESDEFTEIEDPDPENHEKRQRELISEIEEARRELEKKQEKKGFSFWRKKKAEKKDWEVYDEKSQAAPENKPPGENPVMFDIDELRKEVALLSAEGIEIKEIKSTLPPMKIDMAATSPSPYSTLRETKSFNDSIGSQPGASGSGSNQYLSSNGAHDQTKKTSYDEYDEYEDGGMTMTFETSFKDPPSSSRFPSHDADKSTWGAMPERPQLRSAATSPNINAAPSYNAWADEDDDDFGKEKEIKMTFA